MMTWLSHTDTALLLAAIDLAFISVLPWTYFRGGNTHARWWLTTLPFVAADAALLAALFGWIDPWGGLERLQAARAISVFFSAAAMTLLGATMSAHAVKPVKYHQQADTPSVLVTHGPYARIRHPFYVSYLLGLLGCALALPHPVTIGAFLLGTVELWRTAAREEQRLLHSRFAIEYAYYRRITGRFLPWA